MLKKILSASLVILQLLTQSASAFEFQPIAVQPLQVSSDILKNENPSSVSGAFSFFNISDMSVNQPMAFGQGLSVYSGVIAGQTLSNSASWRLTGAYRANFPTLISLNGFRGNPLSDSMVLPEIKSQFQVKPDYSSGFMPSAFLGVRYADGMSGSSWVLQTTKRFVYDGWNMVEEQTVSGTTKYYVYGLDLSQSLQGAGGVGGLLAKAEGTATHQYFYDANGNISQMINASSGAVDARYEYDAYGNAILATGTQAAGNTMRFSTKYLDTEYTLYYYGYRYYDPATGRWLSRDPLEENGGINLYGFVKNSPANSVDLLGLQVAIPLPPQVSVPLGVGTYCLAYPDKCGAALEDLVRLPLYAYSTLTKSIEDTIAKSRAKDETKLHRGRIQAQGNNLEQSEPWAQNTRLTLAQGRIKLALLVAKIGPYQAWQRKSSIIQASMWMTEVSLLGGTGPTTKTFKEANYTTKTSQIESPCDTRIDIEVKAGLAFTPK